MDRNASAAGGRGGIDLLSGWPLLGLLSAMILLGSAALMIATGGSIEGIRLLIRQTARLSFVLFGLTFAASALARLAPGPATIWLRRNRRYLGLSFAVSHAVHAAAIATLAAIDPALFMQLSGVPQLLGGGFVYLLILAMAATSFDRTAAMIGPRAWRLLHTTGAYSIWLVFLIGFGKRAPEMPGYWAFVAALIALLALRLLARGRRLQPAT